jgi:predicted Rossmann fold flavoprotein
MLRNEAVNRYIDIIGGGPAGMMAAIIASGKGGRVRLWEKNGSLGRKLLATGNGRCNFTNQNISWDNYHGGDLKLAGGILENFGLDRTLEFFQGLGLTYYADSRGRYFPRSNEASSVLFCLEQEMERLGVEVNLISEIVSLTRSSGGWEVRQRGQVHKSDAVILACGGAASPQFGSSGQGYEMATKLSHAVVSPEPALVPVMLTGNWFHKLQGLRMDLRLTITRNDEVLFDITDEGLFTHYGLSGPLALKASRIIIGQGLECRLNFLPYIAEAEVIAQLKARRERLASRLTKYFLTGLLPEKLGQTMMTQSGLETDSSCREISDGQLQGLVKNLCRWPVNIKGLRPFKEAQVTAGGVDCRQVFPGSLMSKKAPGLFFCGELLDLDGDTGGYNLQWCWSSGYAAGQAAAEYVLTK